VDASEDLHPQTFLYVYNIKAHIFSCAMLVGVVIFMFELQPVLSTVGVNYI